MAFTFGTARAIVESSFMPLSCRCSHESSSARIRIYDAATGEPHLVVAGISIHRLNTSHEIRKLVGELCSGLLIPDTHLGRECSP